jgi:aminoglycoside 6'-N-acetyltransferase I
MKMKEILVRPIAAADRETWLRMRAALWPQESEDELARECDEFLGGASPDSCFLNEVFVSEDLDGRLGGFIELFVRNYAEGCAGHTPYVEGWYVEPALRNRGVGRSLMAAAERWAVEAGFTELASDTPLENEGSQQAHGALGFDEVERIVHFRKELRKPRGD